MSFEKEVQERSNNTCEVCGATNNLAILEIGGSTQKTAEQILNACNTCTEQYANPELVDPNHWRCLNDSMWSEVPAVKVLAWRMLTRLRAEGWPVDLLDMLYLEDDVLAWAKAEGDGEEEEEKVVHRDSNGVILESGDSVTVIKDLNVKGSSIVAKRGTAVRNISLVHDNPEHIEGKVDGQTIVILTQYVKK